MNPERLFADTNLFLRYLTNDIPQQADAVETLLRRAAAGEVTFAGHCEHLPYKDGQRQQEEADADIYNQDDNLRWCQAGLAEHVELDSREGQGGARQHAPPDQLPQPAPRP